MHPELFILKQPHIYNPFYISISAVLVLVSALSFFFKPLYKLKVISSSLTLLWLLPFFLVLTSHDKTSAVDTYSILFSGGYALASAILYLYSKKAGVDTYKLLFFYITVFAASLAGARLFFAFFEYSTQSTPAPFAFLKNPGVLFYKDSGFVIYGGLIAGSFAGYIHLKISKLPTDKIADIASFALFSGIFLGRLGCFFNGCCFGKKTSSGLFSLKWTSFKPYTGAYDYHFYTSSGEYNIFNTQLVSSFFALFACIAFFVLYKKTKILKGYLFLIASAVYSAFRFCIEFLRADNPPISAGLTLSQLISVAVLIFSLTAILFKYKRRNA
jgi:phosphatidylglycerol:prolipoprotein diacylglycerol transferase